MTGLQVLAQLRWLCGVGAALTQERLKELKEEVETFPGVERLWIGKESPGEKVLGSGRGDAKRPLGGLVGCAAPGLFFAGFLTSFNKVGKEQG